MCGCSRALFWSWLCGLSLGVLFGVRIVVRAAGVASFALPLFRLRACPFCPFSPARPSGACLGAFGRWFLRPFVFSLVAFADVPSLFSFVLFGGLLVALFVSCSRCPRRWSRCALIALLAVLAFLSSFLFLFSAALGSCPVFHPVPFDSFLLCGLVLLSCFLFVCLLRLWRSPRRSICLFRVAGSGFGGFLFSMVPLIVCPLFGTFDACSFSFIVWWFYSSSPALCASFSSCSLPARLVFVHLTYVTTSTVLCRLGFLSPVARFSSLWGFLPRSWPSLPLVSLASSFFRGLCLRGLVPVAPLPPRLCAVLFAALFIQIPTVLHTFRLVTGSRPVFPWPPFRLRGLMCSLFRRLLVLWVFRLFFSCEAS